MNAVIVLVLFASLTIVRGYDVDNPPIVCSNSSNCTYYQDKSSSDTFYYYVNGSQIQIKYVSMTEFSLRCTKNISLSSYDKFPVLKEPDDIKTVIFCNCNAPDKNTSYYDILKLWNITLTKTLFLNQQPAFTLHERHLRDLQIHELKIVAEDHETPLRASKDFLSGVTELRFLELRNVILDVQAFMQFPVKLDNLKLIHAQVPAAVSKLRNGSAWLERLHSLNKLFIQERYIAAEPLTLPKLKSLQNLTSLILINVPLNSSSLKGALNGSSIKSLELQNCGLNMNNLSHNMFEGANLTSLVIKHHKLTVSRGVFSPLQWLTMLDLSANGIDGGTLVDAVSSLPHLHTLVANNNPLGSLCGDADVISAEPKWPNSLNRLELANTNATRICPGWVENDELMHIDLTDNNIGDLTYDDLIMKRAVKEPVVIKLSNNPNLGIIEISSTDNLQCHNDSAVENTNNRTRVKVAVIMETIKVRCDRGGYLLQKALLDCPLWLVHVGGKPDTERLCPYNDECLQECTCSKRPRDNATVVECRKALPPSPCWPPSSRQYPLVLYAAPGTLDAVPANITLLELHAPNNSISRLDVWDIADTLVELDVSYNKIRHISKDAALKLVAEGTNRSLKLEGNSLGCSCSDEVALELLGKSKAVIDWNETLCADNIHVIEKIKSGLCFLEVLSLALSLACLLLILLAVGLVFHFCKLQIRQVLFKFNCCRRYIFRVHNDDEKKIDVFLSFCHENLAQMNLIKNYLEKKGYSTIEHNRDFEPGDPILSQIEDSVQRARRTLVIVSDHFVTSKWMEHEFRFAHEHALKYQTSKVIVVLYNLSKETMEILPSNLRYYIKHHTYINWHDENFLANLSKSLGPRGP